MPRIQGYRVIGRFTIQGACGHATTLKYARAHNGQCKMCAEPREEKVASREVQHARYLDCGPQAWDDRD
jgi:hypothetical protein